MQQRYGRPEPAATFESVLEGMPPSEFAKMTRSTVSLLAWWRGPTRRQQLFDLLGVTPHTATFEYSVRAGCENCRGRGKSSFTDLMLEFNGGAVAIEAKHTENLYEQVSAWLGELPSDNKQKVLKHWVECCLGTAVPVKGLVYQMVHRAASAVVAAGPLGRAHVVHLLFESSHVKQYVNASNDIARALAARTNLRFSVIEIPMQRNMSQYDRVSAELERCGPDALRDSLLDEGVELFEFGDPVLR